jgi:acetyltransferase
VTTDLHVVFHPWDIADGGLPGSIVRSYPSNYVEEVELRSGAHLTLRPIRSEDEAAMVRFHESLSERSVYFRYFHHIALSERVSHQRLEGVCSIDYNRQTALVAETPGRDIAGLGRLILDAPAEGEFALIVTDAWQGQGLGAALMRSLIAIGRRGGLRRIHGSVLADNRAMLEVCAELGFEFGFPEDGVIEASLRLA